MLYRHSAGPCLKPVGVAEMQIINGSCDLTEVTLQCIPGLLPFLGVLAVVGVLLHPFCSKASSVLLYLRLDLTEGKAQPGDVQGWVWHFVKIVSRVGLRLSLAGWDQQGFPQDHLFGLCAEFL